MFTATASTRTSSLLLDRVTPWDWVRGALGGFIGGMGFGLIMAFVIPAPLLEVVIPNMYGIQATPENPAPLAGWFFHQYHAVILGLLYVAFVEHPAVAGWIEPRSLGGGLTHGVLWGVITTMLLAALAMPLWLQLVGFPMAPPFPNISFPESLVGLFGHVVFGVLLGLVYAAYRPRQRADVEDGYA